MIYLQIYRSSYVQHDVSLQWHVAYIRTQVTAEEIRNISQRRKKIFDQLSILSSSVVEDWSEEDADDAEEESDGERGGETTDSSQATLVHVEPVLLALHQVGELRVQSLTVEIINGILEWIFISLLAHALVSPSLESSSLDWHALQQILINVN